MASTASNPNFESLGEEFCWHARQYAAIYGTESVESVHLLLAAAEVTPVELHGFAVLAPEDIGREFANITYSDGPAEPLDALPEGISPGARILVEQILAFASRTDRNPTLRDIWVAIAQEEDGILPYILERLQIDRMELYRRVSGS